MDVFLKCSECPDLAMVQCKCSNEAILLCERHFRTHRQELQTVEHRFQDILIKISDTDIQKLTEITNSFQNLAIKQLAKVKEERLSIITHLIQSIEENFTLKLKFIQLKTARMKEIINSIHKKKYGPLTSSDSFARSLSLLKLNNQFSDIELGRLIGKSVCLSMDKGDVEAEIKTIKILIDHLNYSSYLFENMPSHLHDYADTRTSGKISEILTCAKQFETHFVQPSKMNWDLTHNMTAHANWINDVALSPCSTIVASGSFDKTVKLWSLYTGNCIKTLNGHTREVFAVAFFPCGQILASGGYDQSIILWNCQDGSILNQLKGHLSTVTCITVSKCGEFLVSGSQDCSVKLWNKQGEIKTLEEHKDEVWAVDISPCGKYVVSASNDTSVRVLGIEDGTVKSFFVTTTKIRSVVFSRNGLMLACAGHSQKALIWKLRSRRDLIALNGHSGQIRAVAFSSCDQFLASAGDDCKIIVWNLETQQALQTLFDHTDRVKSLIFSSGLIISASNDCTVKVWSSGRSRCQSSYKRFASIFNNFVISHLNL